MDLKLRNYLLMTAFGILTTIGGCYSRNVLADVDNLKKENTQRQVENATLKQSVDDFRKDFDDFKVDIKNDLARHHQSNR